MGRYGYPLSFPPPATRPTQSSSQNKRILPNYTNTPNWNQSPLNRLKSSQPIKPSQSHSRKRPKKVFRPYSLFFWTLPTQNFLKAGWVIFFNSPFSLFFFSPSPLGCNSPTRFSIPLVFQFPFPPYPPYLSGFKNPIPNSESYSPSSIQGTVPTTKPKPAPLPNRTRTSN